MIETVIHDQRRFGLEKTMSQFLFRGSPPNTQQNTISSAPSSPNTTLAVNSTTTVPQGARSTSPSSATSNGARCCDSGRPLFIDPISGQTVCSCQYDLINYQRLAGMAAGGSGMPLSMYSTPYSAETMAAYFPALGGDQPFYPNPATAGMDIKDSLAAQWYPQVYPSYDAALAGYHFNGYPMDLNGARRKNATRETTSTLKAWLNEHKKNPYPTKGEKIMLAIITKMTLTQVSTWFANARRRLKKENKMTWEPRNRVEDDDVNLDDDDDHKSNDDKDMLDSGTASSEDGDHRPPRSSDMMNRNSSRNGSGLNSPENPLFHSGHLKQFMPPIGSSAEPVQTSGSETNPNGISKPRIWSLADLASKEKNDSPSNSHSFHSAPGKALVPLAGRGLNAMHPYMRPELYRGFYGPSSAHIVNTSPDALLESYQRTFGNHNGIINSVPNKFIGTSFSSPGMKDASFTSLPAKNSPRSIRSSASSSPEHNISNDKILNNN